MRDGYELVHAELVVSVLVRHVDDRQAEAPRQADDALDIALLDRVEQDLPAVREAAAGAHPFEMLVLRPAVGASLDAAPAADAGAAPLVLLESRVELGIDDRRPVVVVRGEDAARPEDARRLRERRLGSIQ